MVSLIYITIKCACLHVHILCTYCLSGRTRLEKQGLYKCRSKSQIFSGRMSWPYSVNNLFILWPDFSVIKSAKHLELKHQSKYSVRKCPRPYLRFYNLLINNNWLIYLFFKKLFLQVHLSNIWFHSLLVWLYWRHHTLTLYQRISIKVISISVCLFI